jgi:acetyltransferase-like isoleucine patch superfamily enzyme
MALGDKNNPIKLADLAPADVPAELRVESYFNFKAHPFEHQSLFEGKKSVIDVLGKDIGNYAKKWLAEKISQAKGQSGIKTLVNNAKSGLKIGNFHVILEDGAVFEPAFVRGVADAANSKTLYVAKGASVEGANIFLDEGDIYIGPRTIIEPGTGIKGPTIIGEGNEIRFGAYFRGNVIIGKGGDGCAFRGELKNTVMMEGANFPHPSYLGDSICGYNTHFGNQVTAANLGIFQGLRERSKRTNVVVTIDGKYYDLGIIKMGVILGDNSQIGCSSVVAPGTLIGPNCIAYALTSFDRGVYKASTLFKNKSIARGVIEVSTVNPL